jgi:hypothetical protein
MTYAVLPVRGAAVRQDVVRYPIAREHAHLFAIHVRHAIDAHAWNGNDDQTPRRREHIRII